MEDFIDKEEKRMRKLLMVQFLVLYWMKLNQKDTLFLHTYDWEREMVWALKLHKTKCNIVQFTTRQPRMMVTYSVDHMAKIWDVKGQFPGYLLENENNLFMYNSLMKVRDCCEN